SGAKSIRAPAKVPHSRTLPLLMRKARVATSSTSLGVHSWRTVTKSSSVVVTGALMTMSSLKVIRGAPRSRESRPRRCRVLCDGAQQGGCQSARRARNPATAHHSAQNTEAETKNECQLLLTLLGHTAAKPQH